jgi:hypothetical protein
MSNFLSGVVTLEKHPRVLCTNLLHHGGTVETLQLKPETYREWEWTRDDDGETLNVRAVNGENPNVLKSAILAKFPSRQECLMDCIRQIGRIKNSTLDLRGTAVKKLPALPNVQYLYLRDTAVKKLPALPNVKTLDLRGTAVKKLPAYLETKAIR